MSSEFLANLTYAALGAIGLLGVATIAARLLVRWLERQRIRGKR
jgi:hypothetical protein